MKLFSFGEVLFDLFGETAHIGGAPLNLAAHFVRQGGEASLCSAVGRDALGEQASAAVAALGVDPSYLATHEGLPTGSCAVTVDALGVPHYDLRDGVAYDAIPMPVGVHGFDILAFGTLALRHPPNRAVLGRLIAEGGFGEIYTDLNIRPPYSTVEAVRFCLSAATLAKISEEEMAAVTEAALGRILAGEEAARVLAAQYPNLRLLIVTEGERGAFAYDPRSGEVVRVAACPVKVASTVGAGDSFGAAFLYAYLLGKPLSECLAVAARVSALVVSRTEAVPEYRIEDLF